MACGREDDMVRATRARRVPITHSRDYEREEKRNRNIVLKREGLQPVTRTLAFKMSHVYIHLSYIQSAASVSQLRLLCPLHRTGTTLHTLTHNHLLKVSLRYSLLPLPSLLWCRGAWQALYSW